MTAEPTEITGEPTALYRFYDTAGALLYVGVSRNLMARWTQHEAEKPWWGAVARKTVVMYGSRDEAEFAEGRAILAESPVHNKAMGRRDRTEPRARRAKLPAILRKSPDARRAELARIAKPREFCVLDDALRSRVEACAEKSGCSHEAAVSYLLLTGIITYEQELKLPLEEQIAILEARFQADEAGIPA